jgi:7-carboxy-7-deazaguanine synthase
MKVNEIFCSIQGESSFAGWPCAFVRVTGCDLRCAWCDTEYAFHEGREMSLPEILREVEAFPTRLALVTGGEPLLQPAVHGLMGELLSRGYTVCLETGGHLPIRDVDPRVHRIMDLKCPSSGMMHRNCHDNIPHLTPSDEVKFVIGDRIDFEWACRAVRQHDLIRRVSNVLFSPVHGRLPSDQLARWLLESGLKARLQVQLHKIIWPDRLRGV